MKFLAKTIALMLLTITTAYANDGLISIKSAHDVNTTADRLEQALKNKGMTVFTRIDHAKAAEQVSVPLRPTLLVIFGNPKVGSPLMACEQTVAIDLPQKALISEDEQGDVWLTYNDPQYLVSRHAIKGCGPLIGKIENALANFARAATEP